MVDTDEVIADVDTQRVASSQRQGAMAGTGAATTTATGANATAKPGAVLPTG